ncbi:MAG: type II toxin-antitoxin system RelE/ParE family toxin [Terracidiphilus sp.]|jgi:plasmid stabilization system protein ParE
MKILWSAASVRHLREVVVYLEGKTFVGIATTRLRIMKTVRRLGQMPYAGRVGRIEGTREAVVNRTPYIVVYQVSQETVEILGIWHGARLWPESF